MYLSPTRYKSQAIPRALAKCVCGIAGFTFSISLYLAFRSNAQTVCRYDLEPPLIPILIKSSLCRGINIGQFYLLQCLRKIIIREISGLIARDAYGKSMSQGDTATGIFKVVDFKIESLAEGIRRDKGWKVKKKKEEKKKNSLRGCVSIDIFNPSPGLYFMLEKFSNCSESSLVSL